MNISRYIHATMDELRSRDMRRVFILSALLILMAVVFVFMGLHQSHTFFSGRSLVTFARIDGENVVYAPAGNGLACVSSSDARLYSVKGKLIGQVVRSFDEPMCTGCSAFAVYGDSGKPDLLVLRSNGTQEELTTDDGVLWIHASPEGLLTVITSKTGYKGCVTVYDKDLTPLFRWDAASAFPVSACTWEDDILTVNCVSYGGSSVHFFRIDQTPELGRLVLDDSLVMATGSLSDGTVAVLSDKALYLLSPTGELQVERALDSYPVAWSLDGQYAIVATEDSAVSIFSSAGDILTSRIMGATVTAIEQKGESVLLLFPHEATFYPDGLEDGVSYQSDELRQIILRSPELALLCSDSSVVRVDFEN